MARVLWKTSVVSESETFGTSRRMPRSCKSELSWLKTLTAKGEGGIVFSVDEEGNADRDEMEEAYDSLVPVYFN